MKFIKEMYQDFLGITIFISISLLFFGIGTMYAGQLDFFKTVLYVSIGLTIMSGISLFNSKLSMYSLLVIILLINIILLSVVTFPLFIVITFVALVINLVSGIISILG